MRWPQRSKSSLIAPHLVNAGRPESTPSARLFRRRRIASGEICDALHQKIISNDMRFCSETEKRVVWLDRDCATANHRPGINILLNRMNGDSNFVLACQ